MARSSGSTGDTIASAAAESRSRMHAVGEGDDVELSQTEVHEPAFAHAMFSEPAQALAKHADPNVWPQNLDHQVWCAHTRSREGFWFSGGLGIGSLGCSDCVDRESGLSGGLSLGGTINDRWLIGVGTTGFAKEVFGGTLSLGTFDARIRFYPKATSGFHLNAGAGFGSVRYRGDSDTGFRVVLGLGWDIRVGRNVSLSPFWNGIRLQFDGGDANFGQIGVGITIH